jgi:hypothetical protein
MPGYQPIDLALTGSVSGWVWGNVAFGGLTGLYKRIGSEGRGRHIRAGCPET